MTQGNQEPSGWDTPRSSQPGSDYPAPPPAGSAQQPSSLPQYGQGQPGQGYPQPPAAQPPVGQPGYQQPVGQPGYQQPYGQPGQDPAFLAARKAPLVMGILSTVFGAVSFLILPMVFGIAGLALGIVALPKVLSLRKRYPAQPTGGVLALGIVGIVLSVLSIIAWLALLGLASS